MKSRITHVAVNTLLVDKLEDDTAFVFGETHGQNGTIDIKISREIVLDSQFVDTVIHEALHAVERVTGLNFDHAVLTTVSACLTQYLIDLGVVHPATWRATLETRQKLEEAPNQPSRPDSGAL